MFFQATFKVKPEIENMVLKSAGSKWRQFKTNLTRKYVLPFIGEKKKLSKPLRGNDYVSKETWKRFVRQRTDSNWKVCFNFVICDFGDFFASSVVIFVIL